ncbi:hypothetical protein SH528x_002966 [Novipirellula sp. SH528]|uniref:hypothetical protein n=1 Tax=Novipirellula sp. SH528 TaxID=3454466 RepID=UPI003FA17CDD
MHWYLCKICPAALIRDDWRDSRATVWVHYSPRITRISANPSARGVDLIAIEECELI